MVNGPEDLSPETDLDAVDWDWVDWFSCEREVRRLRQRIFKATREGDWPTRLVHASCRRGLRARRRRTQHS
jgi:hypothetical protein